MFTYHVSQWARNFTFGMFYAFTLYLHRSLPAAGGIAQLSTAWSLVANYGQYVVLALLLVEVGLFTAKNTHVLTLAASPLTMYLATAWYRRQRVGGSEEFSEE